MRGVALLIAPGPTPPSCADCHEYLYDRDWRRVQRGGKDCKRPEGTPTPCHGCPKSPDGRPNPDAELTGKHAKTFKLYLECKAGAAMPDDPLVRRNCGLIQWVEDRAMRNQFSGMSMGPVIAAMLARQGAAAECGRR